MGKAVHAGQPSAEGVCIPVLGLGSHCTECATCVVAVFELSRHNNGR